MTDTRQQTRTANVQMEDGSNAGKEVAPVRQQRMTIAQEREQGRQKLVAAVEMRQSEISAFLKPFGVSWDFFLSCLKVAMMKTLRDDGEFFSAVTPASFLEAVLRCAMNGLLPDGKDAAIARFKDQATLMIMKDGLLKVMHRTGTIKDIHAEVVTRREEELGRFEYQEGSDGFIRHQPMLDRSEETDEIIAAYCIVRTINGGQYREVVPAADLKKIAKVSRATKGPRVDWRWQMEKKAAIRRIAPKLPKDEGLARVLQHDEDAYDLALLATPDKPSAAIPRAQLFSGRAHVKAKPALEAPAAPPETPVGGQDAPEAAQEPESHPDVLRLVTAMRACEDLPTLIDLIHEAEGVECSGDEKDWLNESADATRLRLMPAVDVEDDAEDIDDGDALPGEGGAASSTAPPESAFTEDAKVTATATIRPMAVGDGVFSVSGTDSGPHDYDGDTITIINHPPSVLQAVLSSTQGPRVFEDGKAWADAILTKMSATTGSALARFWEINLPMILAAKDNGVAHATRVLEVADKKGLRTVAL